MSEGYEYLDIDDLVELATLLLGGSPPIRDAGLLGSAAARPRTVLFGEDAYPDVWLKAAALLQSVVRSRPLVDGNERLGWLATAVFLELNGAAVAHLRSDAVHDLVMATAGGSHSVEEIADLLRASVTAAP